MTFKGKSLSSQNQPTLTWLAIRRESLRWLVAGGLLFIGVAIGILIWSKITPEYVNPQNTFGPLAKAGLDKSTNSVRYVAFICVVLLPLLCAFAFRKMRVWFFILPEPLDSIDEHEQFYSRSKSFAIIVVFCALIASHYYHLESTPGSDKPLMDHFHQGDVTATVVADEHGYVPYRDYFPSRGMIIDVTKAKLSFALFGRAQSSIQSMDSFMMLAAYFAIAWLMLQWFGGNYLASALCAIGLLGFSLVSFIAPSRFSERDIVYALFFIQFLILLRSNTPRAVFTVCGLLVALMPLSFAFSIDRGFMLLAMLTLVLPITYFFVLSDAVNRRAMLYGSLFGSVGGMLLLGWFIKWNFSGFVQFVFKDFPAYREYVEGIEYVISKQHLRGSIYRIYGLLIQSVVAFWITFRLLSHLVSEKQTFLRGVSSFIRKNAFELIFALFALLAYRYALGRADRYHIATGASWSMMFLLFISVKYMLPRILQLPNMKRVVLVIMVLVGVGSVAAYGRDYLSNNRMKFAYPFGVSDREMLTDDYSQTMDFLKGLLNEQSTFVSLTNEGSWYYLFNQPSPLLFSELWYGSTDKYQDIMVNQLATRPVNYVLYSNDSIWRNIDGVSIRDRVPKVFGYVDANFEPYRKLESQEIWIRRGLREHR